MPLNTAPPACPKCRNLLPWQSFNAPDISACSHCRTGFAVTVFPSLFAAEAPGEQTQKLSDDGQAGCFYHPGKKASAACENCGRFLCPLCHVRIHNRDLCPACIDTGVKKGRIRNLENNRVMYDDIALSLSVLPMAVWPFTVITAPASLFLAIRYFRAPTSLIRRTRIRFVLAMIFSTLEIAGWVLLITAALLG